jgi:hypothetical protein
VLLGLDGALPTAHVDGDPDEATVVAATAYLRDELAFPAPIVETHPQSEGVPDGEPIPTLVLTEPAPIGWAPPSGHVFGAPSAVDASLPASLVPRATELLAEIASGSPPPELRPRWARPGWHARASAWMTAALEAAGQPLLEPPLPFYLRGISALLRGRTARGDVFLKAVFPLFHPEPVVTRLLAGRFPMSVPRVHAIEAHEGWLIVADVAAPLVGDLAAGEKATALAAGARAIVATQRSLEGDLNAFVAAGCPIRPMADLAAALDAAIGPDGVAHVEGSVSDDRRARAVAATRAAVERVAALGFPTSIVHGDFHPGNAALVGDRAVIIDWSDAAIGNPAVDLVTWLSWSKDEPDDRAAAADAWIEAWAGSTDPVAVRAALDDILVVGAAYQVVSYDGIVRALEPLTRYTMAGGARHFLEQLEARAGIARAEPASR